MRFSPGLNRGCISIQPREGRQHLSFQGLVDFARRRLPEDATVRPVFAGPERLSVVSVLVNFPSYEACR